MTSTDLHRIADQVWAHAEAGVPIEGQEAKSLASTLHDLARHVRAMERERELATTPPRIAWQGQGAPPAGH